MHQRPARSSLLLKRDLRHGLSIGLELAALRKKVINEIIEQCRMKRRADAVLKFANISGQVGKLSVAVAVEMQADQIGVVHAFANHLHGIDLGTRNKGQG